MNLLNSFAQPMQTTYFPQSPADFQDYNEGPVMQQSPAMFNQPQPVTVDRQSRISVHAVASRRAKSRDRKMIANDYRSKSKKSRKSSMTRMMAQSEIGFVRNETERLTSQISTLKLHDNKVRKRSASKILTQEERVCRHNPERTAKAYKPGTLKETELEKRVIPQFKNPYKARKEP